MGLVGPDSVSYLNEKKNDPGIFKSLVKNSISIRCWENSPPTPPLTYHFAPLAALQL